MAVFFFSVNRLGRARSAFRVFLLSCTMIQRDDDSNHVYFCTMSGNMGSDWKNKRGGRRGGVFPSCCNI